MNEIINRDNIPYGLNDDIGLCYFDPETEKLVEFHPNLNFVLGPFEKSVRRFYLIKPSQFVNGIKASYCKIKIFSDNSVIDFKIRLGSERISYIEDFEDISPSEPLTVFFSAYPSGIIPLDIYTESKTNSSRMLNIDVDLEVY